MTASEDGDYTESEKQAIQTLRDKIKDDYEEKTFGDDDLLYRFLKVQEFDVSLAENVFRKAMSWRKERQMDNILDYKPPESLANYFVNLRMGFDKEGNAVYYNAIGKFDVPGMYMSFKFGEIEKTLFKQIEGDDIIQQKKSVEQKCPRKRHVFIFDMQDFSFATATDKKGLEIGINFIKHYQEYYPDRLKAVYVINGAYYFSIAFAVVKMFLHRSVVDKIFILDAENWKKDLLNIIDADDLPAFLGGKKTDPDGDPLCKTSVNHGGHIDEKNYVHRSRNSLSKSPGVQKMTLSRASFYEIEVDVAEEGSYIQWEFETRTLDIGFGLFFKDNDDGQERMTELVPLLRMDTEDFAETGMYKCDKAGTYVILFDNSYSWIRSKEVFYRTKVITPKEYEEQLNGNILE